MERYWPHLFMFSNLLLTLLPSSSSSSSSLSIASSGSSSLLQQPPQPKCREDERSALLEFKQSFRYPIDSYYSYGLEVKLEPWKLDSWKPDGGHGNCCIWDGVECDAKSGHVIGLDLCCTGLHASINSSSSLFRLVHLRTLNLAYTNFDQSPIPFAIGNLTGLTYLNLSACELSGQIPKWILGLTNLSSLDLSLNSKLELMRPSLGDLLRSLTNLEELDLTWVNISSSLIDFPTNLSSLSSLTLRDCGLHGHVPGSLFTLPNLQVLNLDDNSLSGHMPEFHWSSRLKSLFLVENDFSGELPASIGNLTQLIELDLSFNRLQGPIPIFADGTQLTTLFLPFNQLTGCLPSSLGNLFQIQSLQLSYNHLTGQIPPQLSNLSHLVSLDLSFNMLSGLVQLDTLLELSNLMVLVLDFNNLSVITKSNITASRHSTGLAQLNLASCNLHSFPRVLLKLEKLSILDLSSNKIHGEVPMWFQDVARENLMYLNLSCNSLTGFSGNLAALRWKKLIHLDLRFNMMRGPLPLPLESIVMYHASNNRLSGVIPSLLCSRRFIQVLNLAKNNFTGVIPECFGNLTKTLSILSLHNNNLHSGIPRLPDKNCSLRMLDLNNNQLEGPLPRSLASCAALEFLNFGDNAIEDTFPSWLGAITTLMVLILRSNRFHGAMVEPTDNCEFPALQIIDLSRNNFKGRLPAKYFQCWKSMRVSNVEEGEYIGEYMDSPTALGYVPDTYDYYMTIMNKGMEMEYAKILDYFQVIDFSSNNFSGEIPMSTANLTGLRLLNFSNNILSGPIPSFLGNLMNLEALDLSKNRLSGEIPQQLTQLTFLEFFNVSGNNLSGLIPQGKQF
ncbi:hypothetical protein CRG98_028609 [Punica granatum]|uniref:Uncharacterized protein n=1 Tax=Punica granatum TaxID=22663 RepID=A0A2I0J437_PUNGR|nr:hypothetical protein CRG98_028609 [Punica granatum]